MPELPVEIRRRGLAVRSGHRDHMGWLRAVERRRHMRKHHARVRRAYHHDPRHIHHRIVGYQHRHRAGLMRLRNKLRAVRLEAFKRHEQAARDHAAGVGGNPLDRKGCGKSRVLKLLSGRAQQVSKKQHGGTVYRVPGSQPGALWVFQGFCHCSPSIFQRRRQARHIAA